jgi:hypothetical protein
MRLAGNAACMRGKGRGHRLLVRKHGGNNPLGRPRHGWEDNIKIGLRETGWSAWTGFIWLRTEISDGLL